MAGIDIQAKVRGGLAKAVAATGPGDLVYFLKEIQAPGTPINPTPIITEPILLVDAVFKSINQNLINGTSIRSGDRVLVVNGDVVLRQHDIIQQGTKKMSVESVDSKMPAGVLLSQICIVREI